MNNKAFKMLTLAALSSLSVSALALTATVPRPTLEAPVMVRPTITPKVIVTPKVALPGTETAQDTAEGTSMLNKLTCDSKAMYASLTAGTDVLPEYAQRLVAKRIIQIAGTNCGKDAADMSLMARNVLLNTALCAEAKGIESVTNSEERATILGGCQAGAKRMFGMMDATDVAEIMNVKKIANDCHFYELAM